MVQKHSDRHCSCSGDLQVFAVNSRVLEEVAGMSVFVQLLSSFQMPFWGRKEWSYGKIGYSTPF